MPVVGRPRVMQLTLGSYPHNSGLSLQMALNARHLSSREWPNCIVAGGPLDGSLQSRWIGDVDGVMVVRSPGLNKGVHTSSDVVGRAQDRERVRAELRDLIGWLQPDLIHVHDGHRRNGVLVDVLHELPGHIPIINQICTDDDPGRLPFVQASWDWVLAVSRRVAGLSAGSAEVMVPLHEPAYFSQLAENPTTHPVIDAMRGPVILCTPARVKSEKGTDVAGEAFILLKQLHPTATLVLIAADDQANISDADRKFFKRLVERLRNVGVGDESSLRVMHFTQAELGAAFRSLATGKGLFVHPSREEALGTVLIEAQACGATGVATDVGGIPEILAHGRAGTVVPPEDPWAMADALHELLTDHHRRGAYQRGAQRFAKQFSVDLGIPSLLSVYQQVLLCDGTARERTGLPQAVPVGSLKPVLPQLI